MARSAEYDALLDSDFWWDLRSRAFERSTDTAENDEHGVCECCGDPITWTTFHLHHCGDVRTGRYPKLFTETLDDVMCLCIPCHEVADHDRRKRAARFIEWMRRDGRKTSWEDRYWLAVERSRTGTHGDIEFWEAVEREHAARESSRQSSDPGWSIKHDLRLLRGRHAPEATP